MTKRKLLILKMDLNYWQINNKTYPSNKPKFIILINKLK